MLAITQIFKQTIFIPLFLMLFAFTFAQEVNVYTSRHYEVDAQLYKQFTEETGIKVNIIEAKDSALLERILAEGRRSPADILITADAGRLWQANSAGAFQSISDIEALENVDENLQHPEGYWTGITKRARVIFYKKGTVDPSELSTYEALTDDVWEGRVCIRSSSNIYNQSLLASMIANSDVETAETWAEGMVRNFARAPQGGDTDQIKAVAAGECDVAVGNSYYYGRLANSERAADQDVVEQVGIFFPNQEDRGTHINISGLGLLKSAPNPDNAKTLITFLVSPEVQAKFASANNEFPVVEGVEANDVLASWGDFTTDAINVSLYGELNQSAVRIFDRVGWP